MRNSYNINLIAAGKNTCNSNWTKQSDDFDRCFKLYYLEKGEASIQINNIDNPIKPSKFYFINGYEIQSQKCENSMDVYWLHFIPDSIYLKYILTHAISFMKWESAEYPTLVKEFTQICNLFVLSSSNELNSTSVKLGLECSMQSVVLFFVGQLLNNIEYEKILSLSSIQKIKASLDFMDSEYIRNPSLIEIAACSNISPNHFHRIFTETLNTTPLNYMLNLRLSQAIGLLSSTSLNIKEIALKVGYDNEFYFSRIFKKHFGICPSDIRKQSLV
jgi:AraC-like DNA-binding protein